MTYEKDKTPFDCLMENFLASFVIPFSRLPSQWAEQSGIIAPPESPIADMKFNPSYVPYFDQIYRDAINKDIKFIIGVKAAQVGWTFFQNLLTLYYTSHEKKNVFIGYPTDRMAEKYSKNKLRPFIMAQAFNRNSPLNVLYDPKRSSKFTEYIGNNTINITGANKTTSFTMLSAPIVMLDEMSNIPKNVGGEMGDPVSLAVGRTKVFGNQAKIIIGGTLILEDGILEREFSESEQNYWHMPCPQCGFMQPLLFRDINDDAFKYLKYEMDDDGIAIKGTERILCKKPDCGHLINDYERLAMIRHRDARWIPLHKKESTNKRGYFINSLMSPFETLEAIAEAHSRAVASNNIEMMRAFVNDYEARSWKYSDYDLGNIHRNVVSSEFEIPKEVCFLTMAVDVQRGKDNDNYLEFEIEGWSRGMQRWGIHTGKIYGDLRGQDVWQELMKEYYRPRYKDPNIDPMPFVVEVGMIDVQGTDENDNPFYPEIMDAIHSQYDIYYPELAISWEGVTPELYPIRGLSGAGANSPQLKYWSPEEVERNAYEETQNTNWFRKENRLNTNKLKEQVYNDLSFPKAFKPNGDVMPGYFRFVRWLHRKDAQGNHEFNYNKEYFKGLKSESRFFKIGKRGGVRAVYKKTGRKRNEPLDLKVYNLAAAMFFRKSFSEDHPRNRLITSVFFSDFL